MQIAICKYQNFLKNLYPWKYFDSKNMNLIGLIRISNVWNFMEFWSTLIHGVRYQVEKKVFEIKIPIVGRWFLNYGHYSSHNEANTFSGTHNFLQDKEDWYGHLTCRPQCFVLAAEGWLRFHQIYFVKTPAFWSFEILLMWHSDGQSS